MKAQVAGLHGRVYWQVWVSRRSCRAASSQVMLLVWDEARTLGSTAAIWGTGSFGLFTSLTLTHSFNNPYRAWAPHRAGVDRPGVGLATRTAPFLRFQGASPQRGKLKPRRAPSKVSD